MEKDCAVLIFCRNEIHGKVKTRLAADLGEARAMDIYRKLCDHTAAVVAAVAAARIVCYDTRIETSDRWDNCVTGRWLQHGNDLGARLAEAVQRAFGQGYRKVVLIGTDCPQLTTAILESAFEELNHNDAMIGPAADGGYYLLGLKTFYPEFFRNKHWGTDQVLTETLADAARRGLSCGQLPVLRDVDTVADAGYFGL